ncbi:MULTISPECIES: 16S rRNA (guanine(527)-N(7))-methyltransferase RsmG [Psychrilyobacter]|uniref:Ribosomal RNA small subunit methyltransferase G n=1 Tax=Psychrilyobacter piezotolerans TaxID=2293438 RepID=A0ABX9KF12_9FUSO|nr:MULTISPECIES: 16S rRNA (guanine(527)-N(7))-methyltransferase RsmG [Psychrilyobacter]MCS5421601.1 16S rRNA (guanine(527)-N(7))-methyltransferase RsmG [Psychrilyobacter sp. S5]NDI78173.1 16S rRNA (guanine(527)-N(7))-methyltransferase RsmG [Psychrilyobacter piezotolerans]RDE60135.1 16S rRNA (guanine(527)-N(7))-methyltransferase RsmG [Psychrilyobacter sp. S5]REI40317.1 16S rRNA (guanine(527)-N(7))-methyltransferase RsmG [Psychrilyobacter piezotolerans]
MKEFFNEGLKKIGLELDEATVDMLLEYGNLLLDTNKHTNLTAIRDEKTMYEKHFLDSLLLQNKIPCGVKKAMDIGTGAGFPGMVLAIANPHINFTLMDSVSKKTKFLEMVAEKLNLSNVEVVNMRAEDYIKLEDKRETYDLGLCRGVSKFNVILEYMVPFLKVGATFLAQKMDYQEELEYSKNAFEILNSKIVKVDELKLPFCEDARYIFEIKKMAETDKKYPRRAGIPLKRPL